MQRESMVVLLHILLIVDSELLVLLQGIGELLLQLVKLILALCGNSTCLWQGSNLLIRYVQIGEDLIDTFLFDIFTESLCGGPLGGEICRLGSHFFLSFEILFNLTRRLDILALSEALSFLGLCVSLHILDCLSNQLWLLILSDLIIDESFTLTW